MTSSNTAKKNWTFLLVCLLFFAMTAFADDPQSPAQQRLTGSVVNNGPVNEGAVITFTGQCAGENTKFILCKENTICNTQTQTPDLLCASEFSSAPEKSCNYTTVSADRGAHQNDIATCCDDANCDTTVSRIESWVVNALPQPTSLRVIDDNSNEIPTTITKQETITTITLENQPIKSLVFTNLEGTQLGVSQTTRGIVPPEGIEFVRVYGVDLEDIAFVEGTLTATAKGTALYLCKFWDFALSTCVGAWEKIKPLQAGQDYSFNLVQGSLGFAEATETSATSPPEIPRVVAEEPLLEPPIEEPQPIQEPKKIEEPVAEITIEKRVTNNGPVEEKQVITFQGVCHSEQPARLILCKDNVICNLQAAQEYLLCQSESTTEQQKKCSYTTSAKDAGENDDDIATCCADDGTCSKETVLLEPWTVTAPPEVWQEEAKETEELMQEEAEINKPVKWIKKTRFKEDTSDVILDIPSQATDVKLYKTINKIKEEITAEKWEARERTEKTEILVKEPVKEVDIEYSTAPPAVVEEELNPHKKHITVSSDFPYTNIAAYTTIPETPEKKLRLFWMVNGSRQPADNVTYLDTNGDKLIDRIEWSIPHLSNQTYEVIMVVKADHLDENKVFLTDIGNEVKQLDDLWSEVIPETHYVRVTFDAPLTARHDITIYPRIISGNPKIKIYEVNKSELIAEFTTIKANQYNKVYLDNLQEPQDTFDLHIFDGSLEFNHILDPTLSIANVTTLCGEVTAYDTIVVTNTGELEICYQTGTTNGYVNITLGATGNFSVAVGGVVNGSGGGAIGGAGTTSGCAKAGTNGQNFSAGPTACTANGGGGGGGSDAATTSDSAGGGGGGFGGAGGTGGKSASGGIVGAAGNAYGNEGEQELNTTGSGGGGSSGDTAFRGGSGGAGIRVNAGASGEINIQGIINVSGWGGQHSSATADNAGGGGGSGGHVILIAQKLNFNSGVILADGGHGGDGGTTADGCGGGGGGGGRVVYVYETISETSFTNSTDGGTRGGSPDSGPCAALPTAGTNGTVFYNQTAAGADATPPTYDSIVVAPVNESNYSSTQFYEFNVTWTDNTQINEVFVQFDGSNYSFAAGQIYNTSETPTVFSFNQTGLAAKDYNHTWVANDTAGNENQTPLQFYTVASAEPEVNLTLNGFTDNVTIIVDEEVNHSASLVTGDPEATVQILQEGVVMDIAGVSPTISNVTNYTTTGTFNITVFYQTSENYTTNFTTFYVIVQAVPIISNVILNATSVDNVTDDNLTVFFDVTEDEGENVYNSTDWRLEGESIALFNFPFDTNISSTASGAVLDFSTNGNNGTLNTAAFWNNSGIIGGAYEIPGTTDGSAGGSITIPDQNKFDQAPLTVSMWVKFHRLPSQNPVVEDMSLIDHSHSVSPFASWGISGDDGANQLLYFVYNVSGDLAGVVSTADAVVIEEWMHVAMVINESNYTTAYKNGTSIGGFDAVNILAADSTIFIGSLLTSEIQVLNGTVDEVLLFNRSLSAEQIAEIYESGRNGRAVTTLVSNETTTGDNWTVAITSADLTNYTTTVSNTLEILQAPAGGNDAPVVDAIDGPGGNSIAAQSVTEDSITDLLISFTVTDADGAGDIDQATINLTLYNSTYNGDAASVDYYNVNSSCSNNENISATQANFTCAIEIHYYYISGEWNLTVGGADFQGVSVQNATNFTIQSTTAIVLSPTSLTFPALTINQENTTSDADPIRINNTANSYIDANNVLVTGLDLVGEEIGTEAIATGNFTVGPDTGGSPPLECNATALVNNTATGITSASLPAGNRSVASAGVEDLYVCLTLVPSGLSAQAYSTLNSSLGWTVSVI